MNVLVTGGAGYIGSHAVQRLLADGHAVTVVDNLSRGNLGAIEALRAAGDLRFVEADVGDAEAVSGVLRRDGIDTVMHFAALAYVGESMDLPLWYYRNNLAAAISLLEAMAACRVHRLVFSSSCAIFGEPAPGNIPIGEDCPRQPVNPYGRCKLAVEHMLFDELRARTARGEPFVFAALRYFNVAGCDPGGRLGEDHDPETHLVPACLDAALGRRDAVTINGTDYETPDGTCIRDYVHVDDIADAHVAVMEALQDSRGLAYNVGLGRGYSVREVVEACRRVTGRDLPVRLGPRRPGDPPTLCADPARIRADLGWSGRFTDLDEIVATAWAWRQAHPGGYGS